MSSMLNEAALNQTAIKLMHINDTTNALDHTGFCHNGLSEHWLLSNFGRKLFMCIYLIILPFTLCTNALVMYQIINTKQYKKTSYLFILLLSISDTVIGITAIPGFAFLHSYVTSENCGIEITIQSIGTFLAHFSGYMIVIIGFDRFIHIKYPTRYSITMSRKRTTWLLLSNVFLSSLSSTATNVSSFFGYFHIANIVVLTIDFGLVCTVFVIYLYAFINIRRFIFKNCQYYQRHSVNKKHMHHLATTVFLVVLSVCFCYLPYVIVSYATFFKIYVLDEPPGGTLRLFKYLSLTFIFLNSSLNAVILLSRSRYSQQKRTVCPLVK